MSLGWQTSLAALPTALAGHEAFAFNKRILVLGGTADGSTSNTNVYSAVIGEGGLLGPFTTTATLHINLTTGRINFGLAQNPDRPNLIYICGGADPTGTTTAFADVIMGNVNTDGSIVWTVQGSLPVPLANTSAAIVNGWLYVVGGQQNIGAATALLSASGGSHDEALVVVSGNQVTVTVSGSTTYLSTAPVGAVIVIPSASNLASVHASNAGYYVVNAVGSTTVLNLTKVRDIAAATVTAPVAQTAVAATTTSDIELGADTITATDTYAAQIQSDGSLGRWIAATKSPASVNSGFNLTGHMALGSKRYLYIAGGLPNGAGGGASQFVYRGTPETGTTGFNIRWDLEPFGMSVVRAWAANPILSIGQLIMANGSSDGTAANALQSVDEVKLCPDGTVARAYPEDITPLGVIFGALVAQSRWLFSLGGENTAGTRLATVWQANIQDDLSL